MLSENAIHIRLDYLEALKARRSILSSELSSLKIAKKIESYRILRLQELSLKSRLNGKMKETKSNIRKLQGMLPSAKVPKIFRREDFEEKTTEKGARPKVSADLDSQLREIEARLAELQRENV